jgi:putative transposase
MPGNLSAGIFFRMKRYQLQAQGYDFDKVVDWVAKLFRMRAGEILSSGKQPERVRARSLVCYWAVKELGINSTAVARLLGIIQSSVSRAVRREERLALDNRYSLEGQGNA